MNNATYLRLLHDFKNKISGMERMDFDLQFAEQEKNVTVALVLSFLFGFLGVDRFYLGQFFVGCLKLITLGGCGVWVIIDWFLIASETRKKNLQIAEEIRLTEDFGVL